MDIGIDACGQHGRHAAQRVIGSGRIGRKVVGVAVVLVGVGVQVHREDLASLHAATQDELAAFRLAHRHTAVKQGPALGIESLDAFAVPHGN